MVRRDGRKSLATRLDKKNYSIADYFEEMCDKVPLRPALIYTGCEVGKFRHSLLVFSNAAQCQNRW